MAITTSPILEPIPYNPANPYNPTAPAPAPQVVYPQPQPAPAPVPPTVIPGTTIDPRGPTPTPSPVVPETVSSLPLEFDARRKWGASCRSLYDIRDQAGCGSCWAVATAVVATDRTCIGSAGARQPYLSDKNILTCCGEDCGSCEGGFPIKAFEMWQTRGVVTGGRYGTSDSCQPYFLAPCNHHGDAGSSGLAKCQPFMTTPRCSESCTHGKNYHGDKSYGAPGQSGAYQLPSDEETIMRDLMTNGPIVAGFMVYADFPLYKSGVYRHVSGEMVGGHAIKVLGWGVENGRKYWLAANSWNTNWSSAHKAQAHTNLHTSTSVATIRATPATVAHGILVFLPLFVLCCVCRGQDGFFKIARGVNEGGIESMMWSGVAKAL